MTVARDLNVGQHIEELLSEPVDVACPNCNAHAVVVALTAKTKVLGRPRRLVCAACGLTRDHAGRMITVHRNGFDPWFDLPLWHTASTPWGTVWAYNDDHRTQLRSFVAAALRERTSSGGWRARLPGWMTSATHRAAILKAIDSMP